MCLDLVLVLESEACDLNLTQRTEKIAEALVAAVRLTMLLVQPSNSIRALRKIHFTLRRIHFT